MKINASGLASKCSELGFARFHVENEEALVLLAKNLGRILRLPGRPAVQPLTPASEAIYRGKTLTSTYGNGSIPLHSDCAFLAPPPRYVFLWCQTADPQCGTTLLPLRQLDLSPNLSQALRTGLWRVTGLGKVSFCHAAWSNGIRWDRDCMTPVDKTAHTAHASVSSLIKNTHRQVIRWRDSGEGIIIDNHATLHGRESAPVSNRRLLRLLVA